MPNEPEDSTFKDKVRVPSCPVREVNGALRTYMGPEAEPPAFPPFEITTLPAAQVSPPHVILEECNWVQGLEVTLTRRTSTGCGFAGTFNQDRRPRLEVLPTEYGGCYSGSRTVDVNGTRWHRITQFILAFHSMIAASDPTTIHLRSWVPIDDEHHTLFSQTGKLDRAFTAQERAAFDDPFARLDGYLPNPAKPLTRYLTKARLENQYNLDLELQKNELMFGVPFIGNIQDRAMTEAMGPIYKRWKEHLGSTDAMVIFVRRRLLDAARALREKGLRTREFEGPIAEPRALGVHHTSGRRQLGGRD